MKTSARLCCVFGTPLLFHPGGQDTLLLLDENTASLVLKTVQVLAKYNQREVLTISRQCRHEEKPRFCCHSLYFDDEFVGFPTRTRTAFSYDGLAEENGTAGRFAH